MAAAISLSKKKAKIPKINHRIIVAAFFLLLLIIGIFIFDDYGLSWDEQDHRQRGNGNLNYVLWGDRWIMTGPINKTYGPVYDVFLAAIEKIFNLAEDTRTLYFVRHLINFLFFLLGTFFFYLVCTKLVKSWQMGLMGSLFLILSPRIFAHSFYNPKDLPLMVMCIISFFTLLNFLEKRTASTTILHAFTCAVTTDVRIPGLIIPLITFLFIFSELVKNRKEEKRFEEAVNTCLLFGFSCAVMVVLFWPSLWENPLLNFIQAIFVSSRIPWSGFVFYLGKFVRATEMPWHYLPVWILISTPLLYSFMFFVGSLASLKDLIRGQGLAKKAFLAVLLWFFLPLSMSIILRPVVYDEWRHLFFVYPALLILSLRGLKFLLDFFKAVFRGKTLAWARFAFYVIFGLILLDILSFMVKNHPYQNVYFNRLAGKDMEAVRRNFELDYWGISYREMLEYILKNDKDEVIKVSVANWPGNLNAHILPKEFRSRLRFVEHEASVPLPESSQLFQFIEKHGNSFSYADRFGFLSVRRKMTEGEREELKTYYPDAEQAERIENLYKISQTLETPKYFLTNFRTHPGEYPYQEIYSVKIGGAKIAAVYKLGPM